MTFELDEVPEFYRSFMSKGRSGYGFSQAIKDSIVFEYHDVLHDNPLPDLDFIMARDLLSFLSVPDQERLITGFSEKLKNRGIVILGRNEVLSGSDWQPIAKDPISAYARTE